MAPDIIFGTATFGMSLTNFQDVRSVQEVLAVLKRHSVTRLDTAARYPPNNPGQSEQLLGEAGSLSKDFMIDTKVMLVGRDPSGTLTPDAINQSVVDSFKRLELDSVNVLYAHWEDLSTPIEDQVAAFNQLIKSGKCKEYGLSNHSVKQVEAILDVCEQRGLRKPSVYQGDYNILTRGMESTLLPLLRKHEMRYVAFRPLAAGFLTGKMTNGEADGTRMGKDSPMGQMYHSLYGSPDLHNAMMKYLSALEEYQLSSTEVALRWLRFHSALSDGDGFIIGASRISQLEQSLQMAQRGPLPDAVVRLVEDLWDSLRESRGTIL